MGCKREGSVSEIEQSKFNRLCLMQGVGFLVFAFNAVNFFVSLW